MNESEITTARKMAMLSYIAYAHIWDSAVDEPVAAKDFERTIENALHRFQRIVGAQRLVWGPAIDRWKFEVATDALAYVVREDGTDDYTLVFRGTNPLSLFSVLRQDSIVSEQVGWSRVVDESGRCDDDDADDDRKVSRATCNALGIHEALVDTLRSGGETLVDFVKGAAGDGATLNFTGHSLGGLLAPAFALMCHDRWSWSGLDRFAVDVHGFAGPTAGNEAFARHSDRVLSDRAGFSCRRYANPKDLAAIAWSKDALSELKKIYEPYCKPGPVERKIIESAIAAAADKGYAQIREYRHIEPGEFCDRKQRGEGPCYLFEAACQHLFPYLSRLGIGEGDIRELFAIVFGVEGDPLDYISDYFLVD